jgi:hypothetical protein
MEAGNIVNIQTGYLRIVAVTLTCFVHGSVSDLQLKRRH